LGQFSDAEDCILCFKVAPAAPPFASLAPPLSPPENAACAPEILVDEELWITIPPQKLVINTTNLESPLKRTSFR
jgi:hypothetical protein